MAQTNKAVIVSACRTPIGDFLGKLKETPPRELGRIVGEEALRRAGIKPEQIDELVCGNVIQAGVGGNISRQIQAELGIPWASPACTVNQLCCSSMRALEIASRNIMLGQTDVSLVVGVENMSMSPYLLQKGRTGYRMGPAALEDAMLLDALVCSIENYHMGVTAENVAARFGISRQVQDELALLSHARSCTAIKAGIFKAETVPVEVRQKKGTLVFDTDEHPRADTSLETLAKLKTVFKKDGTVTAGNASGVNDGAAAMLLMSEQKARDLGLKIKARVRATTSVGVDPSVMGIGPAYAIPEVLKKAGLSFADIGYWEVNEAFAAQFLGVEHLLAKERGCKLNMDIVNRNGSGISLGHPVGCSGLRVVVSLLHEMERSGSSLGCASLCAGGGPAMATVIELIN